MGKFLKGLSVKISEIIMEKPFATCSVLTFLVMVMGLYLSIESLLLVVLFVGLLLIFLSVFGKLNAILAFLISLFMVIGGIRVNIALSQNSRIEEEYNGEYARVEGCISSIPDENKRGQAFFIDSEKMTYYDKVSNDKIKIFVSLKTDLDLRYGDKVTIEAILLSSRYYNPYLKHYYLAKGAPLVATECVIKNVSSDTETNPAVKLRNYIIDIGDKLFTGDAKELFKALTAGDRTGFSKTLNDNLAISGLSHIVCVSGLHVSILGMCLYNMLQRKNRYFASALSLGVVILFVLITGASPSTIRAAIMFASYLIAILVIRENDSFTALSFSAFVLVFVNPYVIFDYGFILSFLSVLGIEIFSYPIKRNLKFLPGFVSDSVSVTVSAQLLTLPVLVNMFGYVSVYSILANLLVSTFFLFALYLCFAVILIAPFPVMNRMCAAVCTLFLELISAVAMMCAKMPFSMLYADRFSTFELACYYILIALFVFRKKLSLLFVSIFTTSAVAAVYMSKLFEYFK